MKKDHIRHAYAVVALIIGLVIVAGYLSKNLLEFKDLQAVQDLIQSFGILGPFFVIIFFILDVVIVPIPGPLVAIAAGYLYGKLTGTIISVVGNILGSVIAFCLARKFGRPFVEKLISEKELSHFDGIFKKRGLHALWIGYIFPIFPSDTISYAAGLSKVKFRTFFIIMSIGFIPNMFILNFYGNFLYDHGWEKYSNLFLVLLLVFVFIFVKRHAIRKFVYKELHENGINNNWKN